MPIGVVDGIAVESRRLLDDATRWLLTHRPRPLGVGAEIDRFGPAVRALLPTLPTLLRGAEAAAAADRAAELVGQGVPAAVAQRASALRHASGLLDVVETGAQAGPAAAGPGRPALLRAVRTLVGRRRPGHRYPEVAPPAPGVSRCPRR